MREMTARIAEDPELAAAYQAAHDDYLRRRDALDELPKRVSAGGMPTRVKCLHVLVAHSLAVGPGVNPLGDEALAMLPPWWTNGPCVAPVAASDQGRRDRLRHQLDPAARRRRRRATRWSTWSAA